MRSAHELESLSSSLGIVQAVSYVSAAIFTVMVYDIILTMPREIRFIWRGKISLRKILYLISRYYALASVGVIAKITISRNIPIKSSCLSIEEALINLLLILRINALYGHNKKVLFFILTIYLIEVAIYHFHPCPPIFLSQGVLHISRSSILSRSL